MPDIFKAQIAQQMNAAMGPLLFDLTLTKIEEGSRQSVTAGTNSTELDYSGRGFIDDYRDSRIDGTIIQVSDRLVTIMGASISVVPEPDDEVTIEGHTWTIVRVARDPAGATYECQVR